MEEVPLSELSSSPRTVSVNRHFLEGRKRLADWMALPLEKWHYCEEPHNTNIGLYELPNSDEYVLRAQGVNIKKVNELIPRILDNHTTCKGAIDSVEEATYTASGSWTDRFVSSRYTKGYLWVESQRKELVVYVGFPAAELTPPTPDVVPMDCIAALEVYPEQKSFICIIHVNPHGRLPRSFLQAHRQMLLDKLIQFIAT